MPLAVYSGGTPTLPKYSISSSRLSCPLACVIHQNYALVNMCIKVRNEIIRRIPTLATHLG